MTRAQRILEFLDVAVADLRARGVPAIKHPVSGQLLIGRRGETHEEIGDRHGLTTEERAQKNRGFVDPTTRKFYTKAETGMDSAELMNKRQLQQHFPWMYEDEDPGMAAWHVQPSERISAYDNAPDINVFVNPNSGQLRKMISDHKKAWDAPAAKANYAQAATAGEGRVRLLFAGANVVAARADHMVHNEMARLLGDVAHPLSNHFRYGDLSKSSYYLNEHGGVTTQDGKTSVGRDQWPEALRRAIPKERNESFGRASRILKRLYEWAATSEGTIIT